MSKLNLKPIDPTTVPTPAPGTMTMIIDVNDGKVKLVLDDDTLVPVSGAVQSLFKETSLFSDFTGSGFVKEINLGQIPKKAIVDGSMVAMVAEWLGDGMTNVRCQLIIRDSSSDFNFDVINDVLDRNSKDVILIDTFLSALAGSNVGLPSIKGLPMILNRNSPIDVILKIGVDILDFGDSPVQLSNPSQVTDITTVADSSNSLSGKYFLISSDGVDYYVWYNTGASSDPAVGGRTGIEVEIDINDTAAVVAYKTATALYKTANVLPITAINPTLTAFTIAGNHASKFPTDGTFNITGSTANDGKYRIISSFYDGANTIIVVPEIESHVVDGNINTVAGGLISQSGNKIRLIDASVSAQTDATAGTSGFTVIIKTYGGSLPVASINPTLSTFLVAGNHVLRFPTGSTFNVVNSTANDNQYEVSASFFDGVNTNITVTVAIPSSTADGDINTLKKISDLSIGSLESYVKHSIFE